jgi:hypothetical protein
MFAPSCSPILEDQQCIDMKVFAAAIMHRRREGEWTLWFVEKEPVDYAGYDEKLQLAT